MRTMATHPAARGLADDAAVLDLGDETLVLTHDMMAEGVHWLATQDAADVAYKLVAVNMSDLAAKGAMPLGVLLGFTLGEDNWDNQFAEGLQEALAKFDVPLLGGDTIAMPHGPRVLGLTAIGRATHRPVPSRSGAKADDAIYVVGSIGGAMMGFEALRDDGGEDSTAFRRPVPLLDEGAALAPFVTAMMDVSDGLLIDAARMADASAVTFSIDTAAIPCPVPNDRRVEAIRWGDDYALLFTAPPETALPVNARRIGTVESTQENALIVDGQPVKSSERLGYLHS